MANSPPDDRVQLTLRLPKDLHEELTAHLHRRNSLNQDIVNRLYENLERRRDRAGLPDLVVNVTLDTDGAPISWDEVREHLAAINKELTAEAIAINMQVVTPEILSSLGREEEADAIRRAYRRFRDRERRSKKQKE